MIIEWQIRNKIAINAWDDTRRRMVWVICIRLKIGKKGTGSNWNVFFVLITRPFKYYTVHSGESTHTTRSKSKTVVNQTNKLRFIWVLAYNFLILAEQLLQKNGFTCRENIRTEADHPQSAIPGLLTSWVLLRLQFSIVKRPIKLVSFCNFCQTFICSNLNIIG